MTTEMIVAGFGGQGVMLLGTLVSYAGMIEGRQVSWMPSYGPEQRGGTANCSVVMSDEPIGSPVVVEPDILIAMNLPSLDKFESAVKSGGLIIVNTSMITRKVNRTDVTIREVNATKLADDMGNFRMANMLALGVLIASTGLVSVESITKSMYKVFPEQKHRLIPANELALQAGMELVRGASG